MPEPLVVIDLQICFINQFTHHIPQRIRRLIESGEYQPVLFTRFENTAQSPCRRFLDWHACAGPPETDIVPELAEYAREEVVFSKQGVCGLPEELARYLQSRGIGRAYLAGIDTDMCVLKTAMDLFDRGIEPLVLSDCCASTAGLQAHLAGLAVLSRTIGAQRLREAGIGEGTMAAPESPSSAG